MGFLDSYKRLEKICSEMYGENHGLSQYIEEMKNTVCGSGYVSGWDEDLKQLKHYRWVRNQITHEPGCTEANMCEYGDAGWLDNFHSRIMSGNDPLALYHKATRLHTVQKSKKTSPQKTEYTKPRQRGTREKKSKKGAGCLKFFLYALIIIAVILVLNSLH